MVPPPLKHVVLSQYTWMAQRRGVHCVSPQPESVQLFWVVTGQSAGRALTLRLQARGAPPPLGAHDPAYLSVAAQEQPLLLQQADEVVAQGGLKRAITTVMTGPEKAPHMARAAHCSGPVPASPHGIITSAL